MGHALGSNLNLFIFFFFFWSSFNKGSCRYIYCFIGDILGFFWFCKFFLAHFVTNSSVPGRSDPSEGLFLGVLGVFQGCSRGVTGCFKNSVPGLFLVLQSHPRQTLNELFKCFLKVVFYFPINNFFYAIIREKQRTFNRLIMMKC